MTPRPTRRCSRPCARTHGPNVELIEMEIGHQRPGLRRRDGRQAPRLRRRCRVKRAEALAQLHATIASGARGDRGAARAPASRAKCAEAGGVDLIIIYNSGRYRMAGRGSLSGMMPYGDANAIVVDMAREVLPVVRDVPVLAGVCGTDPVPADGRLRRRADPHRLLRRAELPDRRAASTACSASTSRRPGWATASRSTPSASRTRRTC